MKTMSEWTVKIVSEVEDYLDPLDALTEVLSKYLPMIQQDAVRHAQAPDLPEGVLLSDEELDVILKRLKDDNDWIIKSGPYGRQRIKESVEARDSLLMERQRLLGLLRDLSSDNATERYNAGWRDRVTRGDWTTLEELPEGALFETEDGVRAAKSEYRYGNEPGSQCQCVLLASGEYAHFPERDLEKVREIHIAGVTP